MQTIRFVSREPRINIPQINGTRTRTGKISIALPGIGFNLLLGEIAQLYAIAAVNIPDDDGNLLFNGEVQIV